MKIEELMQSIPPELQGNISVTGSQVSLTWPDGKGAMTWELVAGKEIKGFDRAACEAAAKISMK
ncbi:MAG TPA: hypothetical protein VLH15_03225 [Dehalococcoidales bacterium]|nr:hypothetical protein [Dehalococcoidales bacterium]